MTQLISYPLLNHHLAWKEQEAGVSRLVLLAHASVRRAGRGGRTVTRLRGNRKACLCDKNTIASPGNVHHTLFSVSAEFQPSCHDLLLLLPPRESALSELIPTSGPCKGPPRTGGRRRGTAVKSSGRESKRCWVCH